MSTLEITKRYSNENANSNLSCGGNLAYLTLMPGEKVLDLGCGRGGETIQAAELISSSGFAWGIDITSVMIKAAKDQASAAGVDNVDFIQASFEQIPFADGNIDALISNCAINHVTDKLTVYREIYRVLRPGGRFVISDIMTNEPLPQTIKEDSEAIAACFGGAITVKEYEKILDVAGFHEIEVFKERYYFKNSYAMISRTFQGKKPK